MRIPRLVRHLASAIRRAPERMLHPWRRRRASRRLAALHPTSVLVVCRGNICRSPFGEHFLASSLERVGSGVRVSSAGFMTPGRPAPADAVSTAAELGVDLSAHAAREMTPETVGRAGAIVVMEPWQANVVRRELGVDPGRIFLLGDFDPEPIRRRAVRDPVCRGPEAFRTCYRRMSRCLQALARDLHGGPSGRGGRGLPARSLVRSG